MYDKPSNCNSVFEKKNKSFHYKLSFGNWNFCGILKRKYMKKIEKKVGNKKKGKEKTKELEFYIRINASKWTMI